MSTVPLITVYHNATASQYHVSATNNVLQNADHGQRAAGCCRHSGEFLQPPDWVSAGVRDESPHYRGSGVMDDQQAQTEQGMWGRALGTHQGHQSRTGSCFFLIPLQQRKFWALDYTKGCIVIQQKVCFPSTVRNTMSRSRIPLLIPPLRLHSKWVLVLAVGRWC